MDTKFYPTAGFGTGGSRHTPADLRTNLQASLKALKADKIHMWYLHAPDRSTPYIDTMREVNQLHKEGLFEKFGISNYMAWEVAEIVETCRANGWIQPYVYQGVYNCIHRAVEPELFPCLRHYGMGFYAYNPLVGGFMTGAGMTKQGVVEPGSRFDPERNQGRMYRARYFKDDYFDAMERCAGSRITANSRRRTASTWMPF
jgi:aflatoxin B1 aldehyde reductase